MKTYYRFVGADKSMGLTKGKIYPVKKRKPTIKESQRWGEGCVIITQPVYCPYSSERKFLENWVVARTP